VLNRPANIPDLPGSYQFLDGDGRIIYVGKAKSLRQRLSNYFGPPAKLHPRTQQMLEEAESVEWITVRSDLEALMLEYNLIKTHRPRFNVRLVDDKSYPWVAITVNEDFPRAMVVRGAKRKEWRYFGPYGQADAIRDTLDLLLRSFPIRNCTDVKFRRQAAMGRPCLQFHIERCSGPCVDAVSKELYREYVNDLMAFLEGKTKPVIDRIEAAMEQAAESLEFELAAHYRDQLESVRLASKRQEMVSLSNDDLDIFGVVDDDLGAAVQVLHVRQGRLTGRQGFVLEKVEDFTQAELLAKVLQQHYAETPLDVPRDVLLPAMPADEATYAAWLSERRGTKVQFSVPMRGRKRGLIDLATRNAGELLTRHRMRRSTDLSSRARALDELQRYLGLAESPLRIECYDMSHLQGSDYVGSMVVMEDGLPKRSDYRRFKVTAVQGNDDYGAMYEVLTRRLRRFDERPRENEEGRATRFAYKPQLILIDGGKGQLGVGERVVAELGLANRVSLAALAKQFEEVFVPNRSEPIRIPRDSDAIYLLQQIRDEAHRFAITFHRERRGKRMRQGALENIPGLGATRRERLMRELGGVRQVQLANYDDLAAISWLPTRVAEAIYSHLHPGASFKTSATPEVHRSEEFASQAEEVLTQSVAMTG
jgi:excinuclease ABC subunit C